MPNLTRRGFIGGVLALLAAPVAAVKALTSTPPSALSGKPRVRGLVLNGRLLDFDAPFEWKNWTAPYDCTEDAWSFAREQPPISTEEIVAALRKAKKEMKWKPPVHSTPMSGLPAWKSAFKPDWRTLYDDEGKAIGIVVDEWGSWADEQCVLPPANEDAAPGQVGELVDVTPRAPRKGETIAFSSVPPFNDVEYEPSGPPMLPETITLRGVPLTYKPTLERFPAAP